MIKLSFLIELRYETDDAWHNHGPRFTISLKRSTQIFSYPQAAGRLPHLSGVKRKTFTRDEYFRF